MLGFDEFDGSISTPSWFNVQPQVIHRKIALAWPLALFPNSVSR
jgi:hypothetical protein